MSKINKNQQYSELIRNEVNVFLRSKVNDLSFSFVSITKVELTSDFSYATLYWDTYDPSKRGDISSYFFKKLSKIRTHLAKNLKLRHVPILKAKYDSQFEDQKEIENILEIERKLKKHVDNGKTEI